MRHSANLDILRSFAVILVLIDHLTVTLVRHTGFHNLALRIFANHIGHAGVLAFFVHTSLVLMYSIERLSRSTDRVTLRFYLRRAFRIYPLSIFCITLALILRIPSNTWESTEVITPHVIIANIFLIQNIFGKVSILVPLWSLPYEVQMYLVLPVLYYLAIKQRSAIYLFGLFAIFCSLGFLVSIRTGGHLNMAAYVPCFISGVLCYSLRNHVRDVIPAVLWPLFLLLLILGYRFSSTHGEPPYWVGWCFCLLLGLSINAFRNSEIKPINSIVEKIALYSYGVYLIHLPVLYLVFMVLGIQNPAYGTLIFLALTAIGSLITYHLIESPFIDLGRRLSSKPIPDPVLLSPPVTPGEV